MNLAVPQPGTIPLRPVEVRTPPFGGLLHRWNMRVRDWRRGTLGRGA